MASSTSVVTLDLAGMPLAELARVPFTDPAFKGNARAWSTPYLEALTWCMDLSSTYGYERADILARYALSNMRGWRGPVAKAWKAEMTGHLVAFDRGRGR